MKLVISPIHDPYLNLSLENYFFRKWENQSGGEKQEDILFLYINKPSVVMGRFQNPWQEIHWPTLKASRCPLVRRQSGGGTVYHDMGNLNFSFIRGKRDLTREFNLDLIREVFHKHWGVKLIRSKEHDLYISKQDGEFKVSGNAFKQGKNSSIHHGTLLIESSLNNLGGILKGLPLDIETKAVPSNPKRVMNITDYNEDISIKSSLEAFQKEFPLLEVDWENLTQKPEVTHYQDFLKSSDWIFKETPKFEVREQFDFSWGVVKTRLLVKNGQLHTVYLSSNKVKTDWSLWETTLEGRVIYDASAYRILMDEVSKVKDEELKEFLQVFFAWLIMSWGY